MSGINIHKGNATIFHETGKPYTSISNNVVDNIKNPDALAIWTFLQSKSNNWTVIGSFLKNHFGIGRTRYAKAMLYLKDMGLIEYSISRDEEGRISGNKITVRYEIPSSTETGNPVKAASRLNRKPVNQQLPIKDSNTNKELSTNEPSCAKAAAQAASDAFEIYWTAGMTKINKKHALALFNNICKKQKLCPVEFANKLADDVRSRLAARQFGFDKMHPTTYLNNERWNDEVVAGVDLAADKKADIDFNSTGWMRS